jgi:hypothetical protein
MVYRKRIFLFRPKTNIRQEYAAEYSADNEYSAQGSKHCKKSQICIRKTNWFLWWQLQVPVDLWATQTYCACMDETLTKSTKNQLSPKKLLGNGKLLNKTFFVFGSTCRIFVSAEYLADNFRPNTQPKTFSVDHYLPHTKLALPVFFKVFIGLKQNGE